MQVDQPHTMVEVKGFLQSLVAIFGGITIPTGAEWSLSMHMGVNFELGIRS